MIGCGASGTLTAYQLSKNHVAARIVVIDPALEFGPGLAYSTPSARHVLNVAAGKISPLPAQPNHFLLWLQQNHDPTATENTFAPRAVYGRYLQSLLAEARNVRQLHTSVFDMTRKDMNRKEDEYTLTLENRAVLHADYVVLATGNFAPAPCPGGDLASAPDSVQCHDAWLAQTYDGLRLENTVTLIGTGLTAVDALLRLREQGFQGTVVAISRYGVFPNRHAAYVPAATSAISLATTPTCIAYLHAFRVAIRDGVAWRAAIDSLRATSNDLWLALPTKEQQRFRRHLQGRWNVARHRVASSVADVIDAELAAGTLVLRKGQVTSIKASPDSTLVTLRSRAGESTFRTSRIINCTGPDTNYRRVASPLLTSLFDQGLVTAGPLGNGLNSSRSGALIDPAGNVSKTFFNLGPGRLGTLMESTAIREIAEQAIAIANTISQQLDRSNQTAQSLFNEAT